MSDILTQAEIDELINALSAGLEPETPPETSNETKNPMISRRQQISRNRSDHEYSISKLFSADVKQVDSYAANIR